MLATQQVQSAAPQPTAVVDGQPLASPAAEYQAARALANELRSQLDALRRDRASVAQAARESQRTAADVAGLEQRMKQFDERIMKLQDEFAAAEAEVARTIAVPGAFVPPAPRSGPPEEAFVLGALFLLVAVLPLSIAFARRIWRRGAAVVSALPGNIEERLSRIEGAVDTVAIEVERIGEGQRYVTHLVADAAAQRALGAGAMEPVDLARAREAERVPR